MRVIRNTDHFGTEAGTDGSPIFRYMLIRDWQPTLPLLYVCMKNPSIASRDVDDRTTSTLRTRFEPLGFGGIYIVNLHAAIDQDPSKLALMPDAVGPENHLHIETALREAKASGQAMLVGWGRKSNEYGQVDNFCDLATRLGTSLICLKKNQDGSPLHPGPRSWGFAPLTKPVPWSNNSLF